MTATIDREGLAALKAREDEVFVARHPRSLELFERAQAHMLDGVPMNWMTRWSSPFPPSSPRRKAPGSPASTVTTTSTSASATPAR